jgi:uroporphyrinogen-III synthase
MLACARRAIVITRPAGEAQRLAALIHEGGGDALICPAIDIADAPDLPALDAVIDALDTFDIAIFISPSAVERAMTRIQSRRALPARLQCAAIGPGGVRALQKFGVREVIAPPRDAVRFDSEALLASDFMQDVHGKQVIIFRGDGGRELLGEALRARGAAVRAVTCYRRVRPSFDAAGLNAAGVHGEVAAVIITSSEGLRNLCTHLGALAKSWFFDTPLVVPHPRIAAVARELGFTRVVESMTGDEALAAAALRWVKTTTG